MKKMEFLYQPRGAGKRTVKPSKDSDNLEALVGGGDSGSDDSDFEVGKHSDDNSDVESDSGSGGDTAKGSEDEDDSDDDDDSDDEEGEDDDLMQLKKDISTKELISLSEKHKLLSGSGSQGANLVKVCGACLCNSSDDVNEIVECDGCGISVHEGCYGIQDSGSITSTASSDPTEPWFCEPCRANIQEPECELCPNKGGIYKETDVGKWIHLVCGLYVPNCNFFDPEGLTKATLFEINYGNWGRRVCSICKDVKYSRTGVCISCDAGMCKQYFHVSCAQENGLLSEPKSDDQDSYFGHCKLHSEKEMIKKRKKNWLTHLFQSKQREARIQSTSAGDGSGRETGAQRTLRKLARQRTRWTSARLVRDDPWVPTQKMPRLLTTSSAAINKLRKKVELQEWDGSQLEEEQAAAQSVVDIRKKWNVSPAWSVEFVAYYHDRNNRIKSLQESLAKGVTANNQAKDEQSIVTSEYSRLLRESVRHRETGEQLTSVILAYHNLLQKAAPDKPLPPVQVLGQHIAANRPAKPKSSPSRPSRERTSLPSPVSMSSPVTVDSVGLLCCVVCKLNTEQHLLAKCDVCKMFYHIGCVNPPLARMPKKTKQYGWQCSECDEKSENAVDAKNVTVTGPRASRLRTNPRMSFDLGDSDDVESLFKESLIPSQDLVGRVRKGKRGLSLEVNEVINGPTPAKKGRRGRKSEKSDNNFVSGDQHVSDLIPATVAFSSLENSKSFQNKYSNSPITVSSPSASVEKNKNLSDNESCEPVANLPPKKSFKNKAILKDMSGVFNSGEGISPTKSNKKELVDSNSIVSSPNSNTSSKRKQGTGTPSSLQNKTEFSDEVFHALHNGVVDEVTDSPKHNFSEVVAVNCLNTHDSVLKRKVQSPIPSKNNSSNLSKDFPQLNSPVDVKITRGDRKAAKAAYNLKTSGEAAFAKVIDVKDSKDVAAQKLREDESCRDSAVAKAREEKPSKEDAASEDREEKVSKSREEKEFKELEKEREGAFAAVKERELKEAAIAKHKLRIQTIDGMAKKRREKEATEAKELEERLCEDNTFKDSVGKTVISKKYDVDAGTLRLGTLDHNRGSSEDPQSEAILEGNSNESSNAAASEGILEGTSNGSSNLATSEALAFTEIEVAKAAAKLEKKRRKREEKEKRKEEKRKLKAMLLPASDDDEPEMQMEEDEDGNCVFRIAPRPIKLKIKPLPPKPSDDSTPEQVTPVAPISNGGDNSSHSYGGDNSSHSWRNLDSFPPSPTKPFDLPVRNHTSEITHMHPKKKMAHLESLNNSLNYNNASFTVNLDCMATSTAATRGVSVKLTPPPPSPMAVLSVPPPPRAVVSDLPSPVAVVSDPPVSVVIPPPSPVSVVIPPPSPVSIARPPVSVARPPPSPISVVRDAPPVRTPEGPKASPVRERPKRTPSSSAKKGRDVRNKCDVCLEEGSNLTLVRCDECKKCYHFMCLVPPIKKTPKVPGWSWHCTDCDPSDTDPDPTRWKL